MHNPFIKFMSILFHNLKEIISCVPVMKVHRKVVFLCQVKVEGKMLQLHFFGRVIKAIIIKAAFSYRNTLFFVFFYQLHQLFNILSLSASFKLYFSHTTRVNSYSCKTIFVKCTNLGCI